METDTWDDGRGCGMLGSKSMPIMKDYTSLGARMVVVGPLMSGQVSAAGLMIRLLLS